MMNSVPPNTIQSIQKCKQTIQVLKSKPDAMKEEKGICTYKHVGKSSHKRPPKKYKGLNLKMFCTWHFFAYYSFVVSLMEYNL